MLRVGAAGDGWRATGEPAIPEIKPVCRFCREGGGGWGVGSLRESGREGGRGWGVGEPKRAGKGGRERGSRMVEAQGDGRRGGDRGVGRRSLLELKGEGGRSSLLEVKRGAT